ncbi:MAG: DUF302 domain-containing protein [Candidatus Desulfacyla sp.]
MTKEMAFSKPRHTIRQRIAAGLVLFFAICILPGLASAQGTSGDRPQLVQVIQSKKSFPETLKAFKEEVRKAGWSLLNVTNLAGVLSERGFTLHPVVVLDVCSGKHSSRILSNDDYRPFSAFMPCRVSIYQTSDGRVHIARMNAAAVTEIMLTGVAEVMLASDKEIAEIIANTVR